jgi:hypothetical protein
VRKALLLVLAFAAVFLSWALRPSSQQSGPSQRQAAATGQVPAKERAPLRERAQPQIVQHGTTMAEAVSKATTEGRRPPLIAQKKFRTHDLSGVRSSASSTFDKIEMTREEFTKNNPNVAPETVDQIFADRETIAVVVPHSDEPEVPFSRLTTDCPALTNSSEPINLTVSGAGNVIDAIALGAGAVASGVYQCQIVGGGDSNYWTVFFPPSFQSGKGRAPAGAPAPSPAGGD